MTILHVAKKYPKALGGDAVVVSNLRKQHEMAGHRVVIVTSNCDDIEDGASIYKVGFRDTPAGLDTIAPRRLFSLIALFLRMFVIISKERPDVVHAHSIDMAFAASFAARLFDVPVIHTFHIVTFYDKSQSLIRRKCELWLAKKARLRFVTAPNAYDVKMLQQAGLKQAVLLPNGVDMGFWKQTGKRRRGVFTFLAVGRLERQKGYEYLIRAAALMAETSSDAFRVVIVGAGSQAGALQQLIDDLQVEHIVALVGRKSPKQVRDLLSSAGAVVSPSLFETTPLTTLEAWAAAVPVISTPVGILRDTPTDFEASYVVPLKDEQALMSAMNRCMSDVRASAAIAAKGRSEAKKYAWPVISRTAERLYRSVA